jgi:O-antigen ligase
MKFLWTTPLSAPWLFEISLFLILSYLLFNPPMAYPQSTAVALGGGLLLLLFKPVKPDSFLSMGRAWFLFLGYLLISSFWSLVPGLTFQSAGLAFLGTLLYILARSDEPEKSQRLEMVGLLLAFVASLLAFQQLFFGFDDLKFLLPGLAKMDFRIVEKAIYYHRPSGPLATPGSLAALLILFIPLGAVQTQVSSGFKKVFFGFLTLTLVLALWTTKSVGAWACITAATLLVLLLRGSRKWTWIILAAGTAGILGIIWVRGAEHWSISSFNMRALLWKSAWNLFLQHPLFGTGLGTFAEAYQEAGYDLVQGGARYAHNLLLQLLVETGLAGTGLFFAALFSLGRRFKIPFWWEGWGVMTGGLAFFLFSFLDLPFQMPELVCFFSILAGRLELKPEKPMSLPPLPVAWVECGLLGILLVSGFWPPFQPWNFALLAGALWIVLALLGKSFDRIPLWIFLGGLFIALRAFNSASTGGAVRFLETAGIALAFWLVAGELDSKGSFIRRFCLLGLVWGAVAWMVSFFGAPFEAWANFTNPKHLAVFLVPLIFLFFPAKISQVKNTLVSGAALLTMARLRATGACVGLTVGLLALPKIPTKFKAGAVAGLILLAMAIHGFQPSSTQWDRLLIWKASAQVWGHHLWMGNGPGVFDGEFQRVKEPRSGGFSRYLMEAGYSHNEFLEFLTAFGLLGGLFLGLGLWALFQRSKPGDRMASLAGIGAASLFDFCLHTPRVLLQCVGLMAPAREESPRISWAGGFLALGLACGLFGAAVFVPRLETQAAEAESQNHFPLELRLMETAEQLNAWDARVSWAKAQFVEKLYLATGDPNWKQKSDETMEKILQMEPTQGDWYWKKAGLLSGRAVKDGTAVSAQAATQAWREAEGRLPFSAFLRYEEGMFFLQMGQKQDSIFSLQKAVELEPNYAVAWAKLGFLLKMQGLGDQARQAFREAYQIHEAWKDKPIDPQEKPMLAIPDDVMNQIRLETKP